MRTAILIGSLSIAEAIKKDWANELDDHSILFFKFILLVCVIMDAIEFINKLSKK